MGVPVEEAVFTVVDLETSGLSEREGRIIEVGMVRVEQGRIVDEWASLVNPQGSVGRSSIHGIYPQDVVGAPVFAQVADEVRGRMQGSILAAHNLPFDWGFLAAELARSGHGMPEMETLCTLKAARKWMPGLVSYRLGAVCVELNIDLVGAHSALGDARATAQMLLVLARKMQEAGVSEVPQPTTWIQEELGRAPTKMRREVW